jgi:riboflavin transporter FmnP
MKKSNLQIRRIVLIAIFTALSSILYYFPKFPLPFIFPAFLDIQFSNLPAIIGGLTLGPFGGFLIVVLRTIIKLPSSSTLYMGELADFIIGSTIVLSSSLYYRYHKTRKGGIVALLLSSVMWVVAAVVANYFIVMPAYIRLLGFDKVFNFLTVIKGINHENYLVYYILFAVIPFNLLLSTLVNTITYFVYKKISILIKQFSKEENDVLKI